MFDYLTILLHYCLPKKGLTFLAGLLANQQNPWLKNTLIKAFIKKYKVNMAEAKQAVQEFNSFNDFFIRELKAGLRPLAKAAIVSPVDGRISELGKIAEGKLLQAKGRYYSLQELLAADNKLSQHFVNGHFATLYLAPKDYHRIHMPLDASLRQMIYVPGKLFSVQPTTARLIPHLFSRNERLVCFFDTALGPMAMVLVGATIVGAIGTRWQGEIQRSKTIRTLDLTKLSDEEKKIKQGEEMGYFKLGSTVILLFAESSQIAWEKELSATSPLVYGEKLANTLLN